MGRWVIQKIQTSEIKVITTTIIITFIGFQHFRVIKTFMMIARQLKPKLKLKNKKKPETNKNKF